MAKMRTAAAVALLRGSGSDLQIYLVERNPALRFFGGYWAMPGGTVDPADCLEGVVSPGALTRCAAREIDEEVQLQLAVDRFRPLCNITTPEFAPVRYPTQFFSVLLEESESPEVDLNEEDGELMQGKFWPPAEALRAWREGSLLIVPPVLYLLELLDGASLDEFHQQAAAGSAALEAGRLHPVRFSPGIFVAPLRTATRPPATTTNTFLVGEETLYIIDPGSSDPAELERFDTILQERLQGGSTLAGIVLTHHHPDHVGGLEASCKRYGVPVYAHPLTHQRLPRVNSHCFDLQHGEHLDLGKAPDGTPRWRLEAYHTPGHAAGHLAFRESRYHALIAGDLCSTISTIVIDPPEGHLATYLDSLRQLAEVPLSTCYPSHGPAVRESHAIIAYYLKHRAKREQRLIDCLSNTAQSLEALLPQVYDDVEESLYPLATRSLLAGLIKLQEEGRAEEHEVGTWSAKQH